MCLICGNLEYLSISHLITEINSLSNNELKNVLSALQKQLRNSSFAEEKSEFTILRKTIMALLAVKAKRGIN